MKISNRIAKGANLAVRSFQQVYESHNHLLMFAFIAILVGLPVITYAISIMIGNANNLLLVSPDHIALLKNPAASASMSVRACGLFLLGLVLTPFVGFFYTGVVRANSSKKKFSMANVVKTGLEGLKSFAFWVIVAGVTAVHADIFSTVSFDLLQAPQAAIAMDFPYLMAALYTFFGMVLCFAVVFVLIRDNNIVEAVRNTLLTGFTYIFEVASGAVVWALASMLIYSVLHFLLQVANMQINAIGNPLFISAKILLSPFLGLWVLISATAWIIFSVDICRLSKVK